MVRIPQINNLETALRIYYERLYLKNADIKELFGKISDCTVANLKNLVKQRMLEDNVLPFDATSVDTKTAFAVWGIDPEDLEKRLIKLRKLRLVM